MKSLQKIRSALHIGHQSMKKRDIRKWISSAITPSPAEKVEEETSLDDSNHILFKFRRHSHAATSMSGAATPSQLRAQSGLATPGGSRRGLSGAATPLVSVAPKQFPASESTDWEQELRCLASLAKSSSKINREAVFKTLVPSLVEKFASPNTFQVDPGESRFPAFRMRYSSWNLGLTESDACQH